MAAWQEATPTPVAGSPLLTFSPSVGTDPSTGWVFNMPFPGSGPAYSTSLPRASVSFDFYGNNFETTGLLAPPVADPPPACWTNTTINGVLQQHPYGYNYFLPIGQYHVEVEFFCPEEGQEAWFHFVEFLDNSPACTTSTSYYLPYSELHTIGQWSTEPITIENFGSDAPNFTQYTSHTFGSTLEYSFVGSETQIFGAIVPDGSDYIVTLDGRPSPVYSTKNTVFPAGYGDGTVLWFAEQLANTTHFVTITNLGSDLRIQVVQYTTLSPMVPCE